MSFSYLRFPAERATRRTVKSTRKRVFYLGYHSYSGGPGCCWSAAYWVKKIGKGELWELYLSSENSTSYRSRIYDGVYSVAEIRDYFESVDFELEEDEWREIGLGLAAEIVPLEHRFIPHGLIAMKTPILTNWDGRPAVLFSAADNQALAMLKPDSDWVPVDALDVFDSAHVVNSEADFKSLFKHFGEFSVPKTFSKL